MNKSITLGLIAGIALLLLVAGCGKKAESATTTPSETAKTEPAAPSATTSAETKASATTEPATTSTEVASEPVKAEDLGVSDNDFDVEDPVDLGTEPEADTSY